MAKISEIAYWKGMAKDVGYYYNQYCTTYQTTKAPASQQAPLQSNVVSQPGEILAVDILKFPCPAEVTSIYVLAMQDYFSKWPFAISLSEQKAKRILQALKDQILTLRGPP